MGELGNRCSVAIYELLNNNLVDDDDDDPYAPGKWIEIKRPGYPTFAKAKGRELDGELIDDTPRLK